MIYDYKSLPKRDNLNRFSVSFEVSDKLFIRKGAMIAYYGNLTFQDLGNDLTDMLLKEAFNSPLYTYNYSMVSGKGKLILADNKNDVTPIDIENQSITVGITNLLAFEPTLQLQESILHGYVTLEGTGNFVVASNGPIHMIKPPAKIDPDSVVAWIDMPSPSIHYDMNLKSLFGLTSGEEKQISFYGNTEGMILFQSS